MPAHQTHHRSFSLASLPSASAPELSPEQVESSIGGVPTLFKFVHTVPAPLTSALVGLAPCIAAVRRALQTLNWKHGWEDGWLVLGAWWAACLTADASLRYLLPALALLFVVVARRRRSQSNGDPPLTETALETVISDLNIVHSLLPALPPLPQTPLPNLLRASAILYIPYIALTYLAPLRVLVAIAGTFVFTYRAPWAALLRRILWRSAWIRWSIYYLWSFLSGTPLPATLPPPSPPSSSLHALQAGAAARLRFLFTVYENQRWWMGLDWTAALLPNERPSWCSATLAPVPPPSAFALPEPSVAFVRGGDGARIRRTAIWSWDEPEWKVVVHREGEAGSGREVRAVPAQRDEGTAASKLKKLMDAGVANGSHASPSLERHDSKGSSTEASKEPKKEEAPLGGDEVTDSDGWVYVDNKWENRSAKGGTGKYTRYRRWTRIAVLTEVVETVEDGPLGVLREEEPVLSDEPIDLRARPVEKGEQTSSPASSNRSLSPEDQRASKLKARLQAVMGAKPTV